MHIELNPDKRYYSIGEVSKAFNVNTSLIPASAKGRYLRKITVSSTMGPGVKVDLNRLRPETV